MFTFTKIASGALRLYKATDGMGIKGTIDRTILPVLLGYLGRHFPRLGDQLPERLALSAAR